MKNNTWNATDVTFVFGDAENDHQTEDVKILATLYLAYKIGM